MKTNLVNERAEHPVFGAGTITAQTASSVTVDFGGSFGEKKFVCPSAFESFLTLPDEAVSAAVREELAETHAAEEVERKKREAATEARRQEVRHDVMEQRKAAAKRRAAAKKRGGC